MNLFKRLPETKKNVEVEACILCGRCDDDAGLLLTADEKRAPRHHAWLCKRGKESAWLYAAMLNGTTQRSCPLSIDLDKAVIEARGRMVAKGVETKENKEFFEKLRRGKNPYL